jgi:peptidoglycan/LPS O-acetylase OafA/YrhL
LSLALAAVATPFNHLPLFMTSEGSALPASAWIYIREAALLSPWFNETPYVLISWTLTSELAFYLLVAAGLGLIRVVRRPAVSLLIGFALAVAQASRLLESRMHVLEGWSEFMCGMLVWLVLRQNVPNNTRRAACAGIVALGMLGLVNHLPILGGAAGFALLLILLKPLDGRLARMPLIRGFGMIGVFSYSLYLIHLPIISPMQNLLHRLLPDADHRTWIPVVLGTVAVFSAWVLYRWAERPLESWRRHSRPAIDSPVVTVPVK